MTKKNPHANSEIDTSHIIKSKRRTKPVVQYNEEEPRSAKPKAQGAIKKKTARPKVQKIARPKPQKAAPVSSDDDSDSFSAIEVEEDSAEEDVTEDEEEEKVEKVKKRSRAKSTSVKKPAPKRRVLSLTPTSSKRKPITSNNRTIHRFVPSPFFVPFKRRVLTIVS